MTMKMTVAVSLVIWPRLRLTQTRNYFQPFKKLSLINSNGKGSHSLLAELAYHQRRLQNFLTKTKITE